MDKKGFNVPTRFQEYTKGLSIRAKRVLSELGVYDIDSCLELTTEKLEAAWSCGKTTISEIQTLQSKLINHINSEFHGKKQNSETIYQYTKHLSIRANRTLASLGVKTPADLLRLYFSDLGRIKNCGAKTIREIQELQRRIRRKIQSVEPSAKEEAFDLDELPSEIFEALKSLFSIRANRVIERAGIESLEHLMKQDMKSLRRCQNCGIKTANEILQIKEIVNLFIREHSHALKCGDNITNIFLSGNFLKYIEEAGKKKNNTQNNTDQTDELFADVENPTPWLHQWISDIAVSKKAARAFMLRKGMLGHSPMTLALVAEKIGGMSRERVRQMEAKIHKNASVPHQQQRLKPLVDAAAAIVNQKGGVISVDRLTRELLSKGKDGNQLKHATELLVFFSSLKIWKDRGLSLENGVVRTEKYHSLFRHLCSVVEEVAQSRADEQYEDGIWSIHREDLRTGLKEHVTAKLRMFAVKDISDALLDEIIKQKKQRLKPHEDRIYSIILWRFRFGNLTPMVETMLHCMGAPSHYTKVAEHARKWRPDIQDRNIHALLDRTKKSLLWDRGVYVHKDKINVPFSLIHDIEKWVLEKLKEDVPFISVYGAYQKFQGRCKMVNFSSEISLYSCLRQASHPELLYPKLPFIYLKEGYSERIPVMVVFESFLQEAGGRVSLKEARDFVVDRLLLKEFQFNFIVAQVPNAIRTEDWGFLHLDHAEIDQDLISQLIEYTQGVLEKEEHCSVEKIYNERLVTCKTAGIDGPVMLYYLFKAFADDLFFLNGYPRVTLHVEGQVREHFSITRCILDFIRDYGRPCPYEVLEERFVEKRKYKENHVYAATRDTQVSLYHTGCVIHHQTLQWSQSKQNELEKAAFREYTDALRAGRLFGRISQLVESTDLPDLPHGLYWSPTMIADLFNKSNRFLVLGNKREAFLLKDNKHDINNFESFIEKLLNSEWNGAASLKKFETSLVRAGIIMKNLTPGMLGAGKLVTIKNGEILLRELLENAQATRT